MANSDKFTIHSLVIIWLTIAVASCFYLSADAEQVWGKETNPTPLPPSSTQNATQTSEPITSGVYGPFSSYYRPTMFFGSDGDTCWLEEGVEGDYRLFQVRCLPRKATSGARLAQSDETDIIHAQLGAVNSPTGTPMPEFIFTLPLANMEQTFFSKDSSKRLFRATSIFDDICKLTYQADSQPPMDEYWRCSSFLNYWDKDSGRAKLHYELRVRPNALWPGENKTAEAELGSPKDVDFFKKMVDKKELKVKVALNEGPLVEAVLDLTSHGKWLDSLLALSYKDESTRNAAIDDKISGMIVGPFERYVCRMKRYLGFDDPVNDKRRYKGTFYVDCDSFRRLVEDDDSEDVPKWLIELYEKTSLENSASNSGAQNYKFHLLIKFQGLDESYISIHNLDNVLGASTFLQYYPSNQIGSDFLKSQLWRDILNDEVNPEMPCTISYSIDGRLVSSENFKCILSSDVSWYYGIGFNIKVDYGFKDCFQASDRFCQQITLKRVTSFLKEVKNEPGEIVMEIKFDGGEIIAAKLDRSSFQLESIDECFKHIDGLLE